MPLSSVAAFASSDMAARLARLADVSPNALAAALRSGLRLPSAAARCGGGGCCCTLACCCSGGPRCALCAAPAATRKRVGCVWL